MSYDLQSTKEQKKNVNVTLTSVRSLSSKRETKEVTRSLILHEGQVRIDDCVVVGEKLAHMCSEQAP